MDDEQKRAKLETLGYKLENLRKLYTDLEKQMLNFDEVVPYERQTIAKIFSPRLLNMMLACGPQIESVVKLIADRCDMNVQSGGIPSLIWKINEKGALSGFSIISINHGLLFTPFDKSLEWWNLYNSLKHGLADSQDKIDYTVVMNALAALSALHYLATLLVTAKDDDIPIILDSKKWTSDKKTIQVLAADRLNPLQLWATLLFQVKSIQINY